MVWEDVKIRPERIPWITILLLIVELVVLWRINNFGTISQENARLYGLSLQDFNLTALFCHPLVHFSIKTSAVTMGALILFGWVLEGRLGHWRYALLLFLGSALAAGLHLGLGSLDPTMRLFGFTGGLTAVLGASLLVFTHSKVQYQYFLPWELLGDLHEISLPLWLVTPFYVLAEVGTAYISTGTLSPLTFVRFVPFLLGLALVPLLKVPRDTQEASEAQELLYEVDDYSLLSRDELSSLLQSQPNNPELILTLVQRLLKDGFAPNQQILEAFHRVVPEMIGRKEWAEAADHAMLNLYLHSKLDMRLVLRAALALDETSVGQNLLEVVRSSPDSDDTEKESAAFRLAQNAEKKGDMVKALTLYQWLEKNHPMGSMSGLVRSKIKDLSRP